MSKPEGKARRTVGPRTQVDLAGMVEVCLEIYRTFSAGGGGQDAPLHPRAMEATIALENALKNARKSAYRTCWDGAAFCRFRGEGTVCAISPVEMRVDPTCVMRCRWRGKEIEGGCSVEQATGVMRSGVPVGPGGPRPGRG